MSSAKNYVACDLGAESGRVVLGHLVDDKVSLQECHRFPTGPTHLGGTLRWDLLRFFDELQCGVKAAKTRVPQIDGFSIDAWGVDYAYFSESEPLLGTPFHYRDSRTDESFPAFLKKAGRELIFRETGVQFMQINTLTNFTTTYCTAGRWWNLLGTSWESLITFITFSVVSPSWNEVWPVPPKSLTRF
jgi:rhamnulokinase